MLATLTEKHFSRDGWLFEIKLDGERCLGFRRGDHVRLFSRNRKLLNEKYPELVRAFEMQKTASFIADGEIVTFDRGTTSFAKLQQRMQVQHPSEELRRQVPVLFYAFDLLYLDTYDIRQVACTTAKIFSAKRWSSKTRCGLLGTAQKRARRTTGRPASKLGRE